MRNWFDEVSCFSFNRKVKSLLLTVITSHHITFNKNPIETHDLFHCLKTQTQTSYTLTQTHKRECARSLNSFKIYKMSILINFKAIFIIMDMVMFSWLVHYYYTAVVHVCTFYILLCRAVNTIIKLALELTESLHTKNKNGSVCFAVNCMKERKN